MMKGHGRGYCLSWLVTVSFLATACRTLPFLSALPSTPSIPSVLVQPVEGIPVTPTFTPFQPLPATVSTGTAQATGTLEPPPVNTHPTVAPPTQSSSSAAQITIWVDPQLPLALRNSLTLPGELTSVGEKDTAVLLLEIGNQLPFSQWIYALVSPFPAKVQGITSDELRRAWHGEAVGPFAGRPLFVDESTLAVWSALWGAPGQQAVAVLPPKQLLDTAWGQRPAWGIVPFEALDPRWAVLEVDGKSPLRKEFDPSGYALAAPVSLQGDLPLAQAVRSLYSDGKAAPLVAATNRDPGRLTTLVMTGVTALVRATAFTMEQKGLLYPGRDVRDWLRSADLTHISNEVPFAEDCPFPNPLQPDMRFCSDPRYIALMEDVGTDIVELTGDHFQDWGQRAMEFTLNLYRQRGWLYYGGGENLERARSAITIEYNGNRLAFIGCNAKGGGYAQAGPNHPGAALCDYDWMQQEITRLRGEGYLPVATFQHFEYYNYQAQPDQKRDFRKMAQAGAVIVSGSQAHQPQTFEFVGDALIHYGLGNLFFDQYDVSLATRQAFIDRHVFYDGRYIGTELLPVMFVDYARPRPMTPEERDDLLDAVFAASGW